MSVQISQVGLISIYCEPNLAQPTPQSMFPLPNPKGYVSPSLTLWGMFPFSNL